VTPARHRGPGDRSFCTRYEEAVPTTSRARNSSRAALPTGPALSDLSTINIAVARRRIEATVHFEPCGSMTSSTGRSRLLPRMKTGTQNNAKE
jgi:hypothetical protein